MYKLLVDFDVSPIRLWRLEVPLKINILCSYLHEEYQNLIYKKEYQSLECRVCVGCFRDKYYFFLSLQHMDGSLAIEFAKCNVFILSILLLENY
jgi:hypothetical protein